jgi:GntR family transcriptional regulator
VPVSFQPFGPPATSGYLEDILVFFAATKLVKRERNTEMPPADIAAKLQVPTGKALTVFSSWRTVDNEPFCFSRTYVRRALAAHLSDEDLIANSLVELLDRRQGERMSGAEQLLWATIADADVAPHLGVTAGAPVLALGLTYYTASGDAAFYSRSLFRGDRYIHRVRLGRLPI